ncbi:hypothetical protein FJTKL_09185 [Diaporthe vaccinii]|uniref:Uncharacterized protein n=1 Tax=Diaporthe vaccinii TaxID=105482 RepID=A0ABR4EP54_9PEZI
MFQADRRQLLDDERYHVMPGPEFEMRGDYSNSLPMVHVLSRENRRKESSYTVYRSSNSHQHFPEHRYSLSLHTRIAMLFTPGPHLAVHVPPSINHDEHPKTAQKPFSKSPEEPAPPAGPHHGRQHDAR